MSMSREQLPADPVPVARLLARTGPQLSLPAEVAPFIGREAELEVVTTMLYTPTTRLLTVVGAGGVGKSRLALKAVGGLDQERRRFDAVTFVSLGAVERPEMVLVAIGQALGVRDGGMLPLADGIVLALQGRESLVVLDTFEHVLAARQVVADLLARCPGLTVVVTSRVPLRIYGERTYRLAPMRIDARRSDGQPSDAVQLLVERALAVRDDFVLTPENEQGLTDLCARLDGLPLAIELAAARLAVLSPAALLERMNQRLPLLTRAPGDVPERHRTQRATVAWSYDLLTPAEQAVFRRLAWYADGFTFTMVEQVLADLPDLDALLALENLVDANLVQHQPVDDDVRYRLLDTVREFGLEEAARRGETETIAAAHARSTLAFVLSVEPRLYQRQRLPYWLEVVQRDLENIRRALHWCEGHDPVGLARLSNALGQFWLRRSMLVEGRDWAQRALDRMDPAPSAARVRALVDLGRMLMYQLDDQDHRVQAEAYQMAMALGDTGLQVQVVIGQLIRSLIRGDVEATRESTLMLEARESWLEQHGSVYLQQTVLALQALGAAQLGQPDRIDHFVAGCRSEPAGPVAPDAVNAICRQAQAHAALQRHDAEAALRLFQDALRQYAALGERWTAAVLLAEIAAVVEPFAPAVTAQLHGGADRTLGLLGLQGPFAWHAGHADIQRRAIQAIGAAAWNDAFAVGYQEATDDAIALALEVGWPAPEVPHRPLPPGGELTPRELAVLALIVEGLTDREIAQQLGIKYRTTTTFVTRILTKLDVPSRTAAATTALRLGIVPERER